MNGEQQQCLKEPKNKATESMINDPLAIPVKGETASLTFQNMPSVTTVYSSEELVTKSKTLTKSASSFRLEHEVEAISARFSYRKAEEEVEKKSDESQIAKLILPKNQDNSLTCGDVMSKERPNHLQASEVISDPPSQSVHVCQKDGMCSFPFTCEVSENFSDKSNVVLNNEHSNSGSEPTNSQGNKHSDHQSKKRLNSKRSEHLDIEQQQYVNDPESKTTETTIKDTFLTSVVGKSDSLKPQRSVTVYLPEELMTKWKNLTQSASSLKVQQEVGKKSRESQFTKPLLSNNHDNSQRQNQLQENKFLSDPPSESSHLCQNDEVQKLHIGHDSNCSESEIYKSNEALNNEHSNSSGNKLENSHKNKQSNHLHKKLLNSERNEHSENTYSDSLNGESHKQSKSSSLKRLCETMNKMKLLYERDYVKCLSSRDSKRLKIDGNEHLNKSSNEGLNTDHDKCSNSRNNKHLKSDDNKHLNGSSNVSLNSGRNKFSNNRSNKHLKLGAQKHSNRSSCEGLDSKNDKRLKNGDNGHLNRSGDEDLYGGHNKCSNSRNNKQLKSDVSEHLIRSSNEDLNSDHNKCSDGKNKHLKSGGNKRSNRCSIETLNSDHNKCSNTKNDQLLKSGPNKRLNGSSFNGLISDHKKCSNSRSNKRLKSSANKYLNRSSNEDLGSDHNKCSNSKNNKCLKSDGNKHSNKSSNVRLNGDPNKFSNRSNRHLKVGANERSNRSSNENLSNNRDSDSDCDEHSSDSDFSTTNIMNETITPSRKRLANPMDQKQKADEKSKASTATVQEKIKAQLEAQTNKEWSLSEQLAFMKAVKQYGTSNPKKLAKEIKTCNVDQVKYFITAQAQRLRMNRRYVITTQAQKLCMNRRSAIIKKVTSENSDCLVTSSNFETRKPVNPDLSSDLAVPKLLQYPALHLWRKMDVHNRNAHSSRDIMVKLFKNFREQAQDFNDPNIPKFKTMYKYFENLLSGHIPQALGPLETHLICQLRDEMFRRCGSMDKEKEMMKNYNGWFKFISASSVKGSHSLYYSKGLIPLEDSVFKKLRKYIRTYNALNPLRLPVGEEKTEYTEKIAMVHKGREKMIAVLQQIKMENAAKLRQMKKRKAAELRRKIEKARKLQQKNTVTARNKLQQKNTVTARKKRQQKNTVTARKKRQQSNKNISQLHRKDKIKPIKPARKKKKNLSLSERIIENYLTCSQQGKTKLRYWTVI